MGELEDKLNSILSSPEEMEKIMDIARSLSGSVSGSESDDRTRNAPPAAAPLMGDIDPKLLGLFTRLMGAYNTTANDKSALLSALKPYLKKERHAQIDRAAQIAKLARIAKLAFFEFSGGEQDV